MKYRNIKQRGYTMIDMIMAIAIITIITGIIMVGRKDYSKSIILTNLTYDVALSIREAQVYGINARRAQTTGTSGTFDAGYGVYFSSGNTSSYILFADLDNDHIYDSGELIRTYQIPSGFSISGRCMVSSTNVAVCNSVNNFTITFRRPDPNACLLEATGVPAGGSGTIEECQSTTSYIEGRITLSTSDASASRLLKVYTTGQISVP